MKFPARRFTPLVLFLLIACTKHTESIGDARRGQQLITQYGCASCHIIPGVEGPKGVVGPPLEKMGQRTFIAGKVQNTPENLVQWLQNPQGFDPGNAMPNLGVSDKDARDMAAFLFTLK